MKMSPKRLSPVEGKEMPRKFETPSPRNSPSHIMGMLPGHLTPLKKCGSSVKCPPGNKDSHAICNCSPIPLLEHPIIYQESKKKPKTQECNFSPSNWIFQKILQKMGTLLET